MKKLNGFVIILIMLVASLLIGQGISYALSPASWIAFAGRLPRDSQHDRLLGADRHFDRRLFLSG